MSFPWFSISVHFVLKCLFETLSSLSVTIEQSLNLGLSSKLGEWHVGGRATNQTRFAISSSLLTMQNKTGDSSTGTLIGNFWRISVMGYELFMVCYGAEKPKEYDPENVWRPFRSLRRTRHANSYTLIVPIQYIIILTGTGSRNKTDRLRLAFVRRPVLLKLIFLGQPVVSS